MAGPKPAALREDLKGKIAWFISLRWLAAVGLVLAVTVSHFFFAVVLPLPALYAGAGVLLLYNAVVHRINHRLRLRLEEQDWLERAYRLASLQVFLDLSLLTYLLFFSGGLENPFVFYYIFHMILSSILLTRRSAYLQGTFAVCLFALLILGHRLGWVAALPLAGPGTAEPFRPAAAAIAGWLVAFASTVYIAVYLTSTIVGQLRDRERELEGSYRKLEEQDRLKSQYVLTVSHDIQATLSAIHSLLMTVLGGFTGRIGHRSRELIERASIRSQELLRFVRDLLDISRMRTETKVERKPVALLEAVESQAELFRAALQNKGIALELDAPDLSRETLTVWANPTAFSQLLNNLISNAVRYTPAGGRIDIGIRAEPGERRVWIRVSDTGIGIPAESLPHIFDDFYRAGNAREFTDSGTGLGLAIVKKIVESHGGQIRVDSQLGKGTSFCLSLPTYPPEPPSESLPNGSTRA
jgi:signal transduction histidine kinase